MKRIGACIDLSDGFAGDLEHLLQASSVGAEIRADRIPVPRGFAAACSAQKLDPAETAIRSGEDYELLFTLRSHTSKRISEAALSERLGVRVSEVGRITEQRGVTGLPTSAKAQGHRHF